MPATTIAFDLTRLISRLRHASPSGIDRVDLAYARHFLRGDGARFGLVWTPCGARVVARAIAARIVDAVESGWLEESATTEDPVYRTLAEDLGQPIPSSGPPEPGKRHRPESPLFARRLQVETVLRALRRDGPERLPHGTIYINTSHLGLERPERFDWLHARPDIRSVFFVHDLIPISHPEYGRPGESERHRVRMATIARHATHVVVNSADVGERFADHLAEEGLGRKPVTVAWLGVEPAFLQDAPAATPPVRPTFVVCGTVEARKNHLLLLKLWRDFAERRGALAPRLVVVGRRGWEAESVFDMLDRCPGLREPVRQVVGLTTHGLARLMRASTALLMPSFIEGYGLPIVEAAASGLPVVASDIAVHREIADGFAHFLDPLDGPGWRTAIEALSEPDSPLRERLASQLHDFAAPRWDAHFARVDAALTELAAG